MSAAAEVVLSPSLDDIVEEGLARLLHATRNEATVCVREFDGRIDQLIERARCDTPQASGWASIANRLGLTHLETLAGALALRCEWDVRTADRVRRLQSAAGGEGAARPSLGLIVHLWIALEPRAQSAKPRLLALLCAGRAVASGAMVVSRSDTVASARTLAVHPALVAPLLDPDLGAASSASFGDLTVRCIEPPAWSLPRTWRDRLAQLARELQRDSTIIIRCHDPLEARALAAMLAVQVGRDAVEVPATVHWPAGLEPWLLARRALPVVRCEPAPGERISIPCFERGPLVIAAGVDGDIACAGGGSLEWRPNVLSPEQRAEVLEPIIEDRQVRDWLARSWRAGVSALYEAATSAVRIARTDGRVVAIDDARAAVAMHAGRVASGFGALAQPVSTDIEDESLVASPTLRRDLDSLRAHCRHREMLFQDLGAAVRARGRTGVAALFVGPSGTGKTLAVQWLAHVLHKPLLRVDAAGIASKYIGETEKNLARLLAQAEHSDCVLLFDEADALFGSRTEVRQSNDRFANAQTNYLLTRIESFGGIAVLTSNSKARFDDAFMRRLDAVVEFPLPDARERAALWRAHLGAQRPADDVVNLVAAQAELAGGHIRNAAIAAALHARERGENQHIRHADLIAGITAEYRKLGRAAPDLTPPR